MLFRHIEGPASRYENLQLGLGHNAGVALKFLAAGAAQAVCLDKFYSARDSDQQRQIYQALRGTLSEAERKGFDDAVNLENDIQFNPDKLKCTWKPDLPAPGLSIWSHIVASSKASIL